MVFLEPPRDRSSLMIVCVVLVFPYLFHVWYFQANHILHQKHFNTSRSYADWSYICGQPRPINSQHYNDSFDYVYHEYEIMVKKVDTGLMDVKFIKENGTNFGFGHGYYHFQGGLRNHAILISPKKPKSNVTLMFSAHMDSHNTGNGAHDDGINVAVFLELARAIIYNSVELKCPIRFEFIGSEEHGLDGSSMFVKQHPNETFVFFNLEAMGSGKPMGMFTKGEYSSHIQRVWSSMFGTICATFGNEILNSGLITSDTDATNYKKAGWAGGEITFIGNPAYYHTLQDSALNKDDIGYLGSKLLKFIKKYDPTQKERQGMTTFGIVPFNVVFYSWEIKLWAIILSICGIFIGCVGFYMCPHQIIKCVLYFLAAAICFAFTGLLFLKFNSLVFVAHPHLSVVLIGLSFALSFASQCSRLRCPVGPLWAYFQTLLHSLVALGMMWSDFDVPILLSLIFTIAYTLFWRNYFNPANEISGSKYRLVSIGLRQLPRGFLLGLLFPLSCGLTNQMRGPQADWVVWILLGAVALSWALTLCSAGFPVPKKAVYLFPLTVLFFLALPRPYSQTYPMKVHAAQLYFLNGSSKISVVPMAGDRAAADLKRALIHQSHDKNSQNDKNPQNDKNSQKNNGEMKFVEHDSRPLMAGPAIVQEFRTAELPEGVEWPEYEVKRAGDKITVIADRPEGIESMNVVIKCRKKRGCLKSVMGNQTIEYIKKPQGDEKFAVFVKAQTYSGKYTIEAEVKEGENVDLDIAFVSLKRSKEWKNFWNNLADYVMQFQIARGIPDTVLLDSTTI